MSLRLRLTLLATVLTGLTLLGFGLVVYVITGSNLYSGVDEVLEGRAREVRRFLRATPPERGPVVDRDVLAEFTPDEFSEPGVYIELLDASGRVIDTSANLGDRRLPAHGPVEVDDHGQAQPTLRTYRVGSRERVRVLHVPLDVTSEETPWIAIGQSLSTVDRTMSDLRNIMLSGGVGALVLVGAAGYVLAGRGLRPLNAVSATAVEISQTGDFSRRITTSDEAPEVERLGRTFNELIDTVERTFKAQRSFLADSSHELRRPLTIIRGDIDLLANPNLSDEGRRESLEEIRIEAEQMSALLSDLLLLSRVEVGQAMQRSLFDFGELVQDVMRRRRDPEPHPAVEVATAGPLLVEGDETRLRQLVSNLVDNAVRYTPPQGHVRVTAFREDGHVALQVKDDGIGIEEGELSHVFDRFYRGRSAQMHSEQGVGLGLAIVRFIAEAHGGDVGVESTPGHGSCFTVTLPAGD